MQPDGIVPATAKEDALWFLETLVPGTGVNNIPFAFRVDGRLHAAAFQEAMNLLVRRHEILRTNFHLQEISLVKDVLAPQDAGLVVETHASSDEEVQRDLEAFAARPFDLDGRPLIRAATFATGNDDVFCVVAHHLVFDGLSVGFFMEDLVAAYNALVAGEEVPAELRQVVRPAAEAEPSGKSLAFWREHLKDVDSSDLALAVGADGPAEPTLVGATVVRDLSPDARDVVARLQKELRAPEAVILFAAYYALLAWHGAGDDVVVGTPVNVRGPEAGRAIGYHVNTLSLRVKVDFEEGFRQLVKRTRDVFFGAMAHADVTTDVILQEVSRTDSAWRTTLFRHMFNYVPFDGLGAIDFGGHKALPIGVENGYSKFDLEFFIIAAPDSTRLRAVYYEEVFERADIEAVLARYESFIMAVGDDPDLPIRETPAWSDRDRLVIEDANMTASQQKAPLVLRAVADHVTVTPDAVAFEDNGLTVTYRQLWQMGVATRDRLLAAGVGPGDVVATAASRGAGLGASLLGIWMTGAGYLALDPDHPEQRIAYLLKDSGVAAVVARDGFVVPEGVDVPVVPLVRVQDAVPADDDIRWPQGLDCGYMIYTSGSTGRPKGIRLSHANLANLIAHMCEELRAEPGDRALWLTTFAFDISALEVLMPLFSGGVVVVAPDEARTDGRVLADLIERYDVGLVQATPTTWRLVCDAAGGVLAGRKVLCGGEPMSVALARRLVATGCELRNVYGPSETTIWSTAGRVGPDVGGVVGVGRPVRNTVAFVVAPDGRELPVGVLGELCIAGEGVGAGYHGRPELTADRFRVHPVYGRYYLTGDLAKWLPDGDLQVLGRADRQVKLRGNRIELGEIEGVLARHDTVRGAAVVVVGDPSADAILVAFVEAPDEPGTVDRLWAHARAELPPSAVPHRFVVLDAMPVTANEKTDYPTLVRMGEESRVRHATEQAPGSDDELTAALVGLWREILDDDSPTAHTNFFVSGGHSLLAAKLLQRVKAVTGVRLKLADVFSRPTPAALAEHVRALASVAE
ncbi:amino acid adenylation domain-containing protein [Streptomyces sp. SL13]|uniref:Amino acid adenylation domain-containing protein n=1 Tax=Streptantibioticus silvisoli TaxID=2705255 RepID=A0AA90H2Z5_9ACTN|nr:amino acid adenylation domain-containing protein [Streptantibioticus silvisoli]MDI5967910.1 amino acid adenylation domain-containing protein [Streptantibioticus silvisoli]